ncbi:MAG: hypothetical protein MN733_29445 [Nitrososphaera sp.]|nr:hypothetical protein [Nitrososphaera sp.]
MKLPNQLNRFSKKFDRLSAVRKFMVVALVWFLICVPAVPFALTSDHRVFEGLGKVHFVLFGVTLSALYAALLAGIAVLSEKAMKHVGESKPRWLVCVMWLAPVWSIALIYLSAKWLLSDDPGWFLAVLVSFCTGYVGREVDPLAGKFCMIFAGILLFGGLLLPTFANVCR